MSHTTVEVRSATGLPSVARSNRAPAHHRRGPLEAQLVGDGDARAAAAAVAEVARDAHRVGAHIERALQVANEVAPADARGVVAVVLRAAVGVGVEDRPEPDARERGDEGRGRCQGDTSTDTQWFGGSP